jgi:hypothetical protein
VRETFIAAPICDGKATICDAGCRFMPDNPNWQKYCTTVSIAWFLSRRIKASRWLFDHLIHFLKKGKPPAGILVVAR